MIQSNSKHQSQKSPASRLRRVLLGAAAVASGVFMWQIGAYAFGGAEPSVVIAAPKLDEPSTGARTETAVFAGGCFWGVQGVFQHVKGVTKAESGYAGGTAKTADYETVSSGSTGHAESVQVTFDPQQVSYGKLLQIYFSVAHNPTEVNRQGPDSGTQYRSAVFPMTDAQRQVATAYIAQLDASHAYSKPIATKVEKYTGFYAAETYHQDFLTEHPNYPYIVINDLPKVKDLKRIFPTQYRDTPVLVKTASAK
ncbi:peptide-methionine (S)-S-oxide reductase MsrA [Pandoraea sputorum]|uniref:Peptide methionine sulfoxide reductase MsrA n=1 Tax=Pandoraea sputorum TaxID=93222 RepID=A0A239SB04_9BURK|nr:peptide-methionine (S)-S-oxide reductase MsrA [Pandoraea sputorum]AJC18720.2 peptide-methionine (S)-S-oxide reductase [Pandoraea sputorum]SNU82581.1 Peptide methionine sulfoxide reductase MsrA 1 [Pandoraea sputorum]VVE10019.1 peptide-methionine (S)-S-oxide reductase [Pandoraea sputorum]